MIRPCRELSNLSIVINLEADMFQCGYLAIVASDDKGQEPVRNDAGLVCRRKRYPKFYLNCCSHFGKPFGVTVDVILVDSCRTSAG
jgi:hypothetical protein